jgi:serine/threonine protein kinase
MRICSGHPFIVQLLEVFNTSHHLAVVMELADGGAGMRKHYTYLYPLLARSGSMQGCERLSAHLLHMFELSAQFAALAQLLFSTITTL